MKRLKSLQKLDKFSLFLLITVFVTSFVLFMRTDFCSDDWTYMQAAICSPAEVFDFIKWHIMNCNGRTFVHSVLLLFLGSDYGLIIWKILCSVCVPTSFVLAGKIAFEEKMNQQKATAVIAAVFLLIDPVIWQTSVFWMTGSFNYFLPTVVLLLLMYRVIRQHRLNVPTFLLALFCGATTEQIGMMSVGLFALMIINSLREKNGKISGYILGLFFSLAGLLSILLSPGTSQRSKYFGMKTSPASLLDNGIKLAKDNWINNDYLFFFLVIACILTGLTMYRIAKKNKIIKILCILNVFLGVINSVYSLISDKFENILQKFIPEYFCSVLFVSTLTVFVICTAYVCIKLYFSGISKTLILYMILGAGSQLMLVPVNNNPLRTALPSLFCFLAALSVLAVLNYNSMAEKNCFKKFSVSKAAAAIALIIISAVFQYSLTVVKHILPMSTEMTESVNLDLLDESGSLRPLDSNEIEEYETWLADALSKTQKQ